MDELKKTRLTDRWMDQQADTEHRLLQAGSRHMEKKHWDISR